MAKLSTILPFLFLLLAIALPLMLAASGDAVTTTTTEADCFHRPDESDEDVLLGGSMPSKDDDVELESEQLDGEGLFEDDVELESEQLDGEGLFEDDVELENEQHDDEALLEDENDETGYIVMPTDHQNDEEDDDTESLSPSNESNSDFESEDEEDTDDEGKLGVAVDKVVTAAFFNSIIKNAGSTCKGKRFYTRAAFLTATKSYPEFGKQSSDAATKREIAAFFAHVTHETGSLCYVEEIKKATYCESKATKWPCAPGKQYYGRGPLQLTWNYNYGPCGKANKFDGLKNPDIVAKNKVIAWKASLWFWKKSVRPVLKKGFAATIRAINGGECNGGNRPAVESRVKFYKKYCKRFGVKPGSKLSC
ncbi:unnamed protein product [Linum tenue]|uniref:chitinase n=1 Tax=Linum tenue TaxID=586396 RepID=A0AAV0KCD6_9ROSI|nr:unnamed protein product [Linum tenue]